MQTFGGHRKGPFGVKGWEEVIWRNLRDVWAKYEKMGWNKPGKQGGEKNRDKTQQESV